MLQQLTLCDAVNVGSVDEGVTVVDLDVVPQLAAGECNNLAGEHNIKTR